MKIPSIKNFETLSWAHLSLYHLFPGFISPTSWDFQSPYFHSALAGETLFKFLSQTLLWADKSGKMVPLKSVMVPHISGILVPVINAARFQ